MWNEKHNIDKKNYQLKEHMKNCNIPRSMYRLPVSSFHLHRRTTAERSFWRRNQSRKLQNPEAQFFRIFRNLPHSSQSNNLPQSSHSIFSSSNLSHTASPPFQLLFIPTVVELSIQPVQCCELRKTWRKLPSCTLGV